MSGNIAPLPLPFVTNVTIDARSDDVHIQVDPALIFRYQIAPGEVIPDDQETGVSLLIQKGKAVSIITVLTGDRADQLVEALVTCIVRGDEDRVSRATALLERIERAVGAGFEAPLHVPGTMPDIERGNNAQTDNIEGLTEDGVPCCTQDDLS
ncbi:hypothetical protein LCGC14_1133490 [marine sediment metagenome]|uniref:Uncharacterized protein n=1 Tax=marine sediment metagenome TaxID=412755 RepID=A0A0F9PIQ1_9ZZZZ